MFIKLILMVLSFVTISVHGMELVPDRPISFDLSLWRVHQTGKIDWLEQFVYAGKDLNKLSSSDMYPVAEIIRSHFDSSLVAAAIGNGARVDLPNHRGQDAFYWIVCSYKRKSGRMACSVPKMNLLSALALPTYQYPEDEVVSKEEKLIREEKLQALKTSIKTFLLCVNKPDWQCLKSVRYIILAYMQGESARDGIYCQGMFGKVVEHVTDLEQLVALSPLEWFKAVVQSRAAGEQTKFIKKFAPLIARYRLNKAHQVLSAIRKNNYEHATEDTLYTLSTLVVKNLNWFLHFDLADDGVQVAQEMANDLDPVGFVERHLRNCARIIENVLLGKDSFEAFDFNPQKS